MACYRVKALPNWLAAQTRDELRQAHGGIPPMQAQIDAISRVHASLPAAPPSPDDAAWFLCGDFGPACMVCGDVSDVLCDYPVGKGKTCDRALCAACTPETAPDVHYCPGHRAEFEAFRAAGGVKDKLENLIPFVRPMPRPPGGGGRPPRGRRKRIPA